MQSGNLIRVASNIWPGVVANYYPDANKTTFDSARLNWFQRRELRKAIDETVASLDVLFSGAM
jgi:hypothetical protein